jgi:hypothetical protein
MRPLFSRRFLLAPTSRGRPTDDHDDVASLRSRVRPVISPERVAFVVREPVGIRIASRPSSPDRIGKTGSFHPKMDTHPRWSGRASPALELGRTWRCTMGDD